MVFGNECDREAVKPVHVYMEQVKFVDEWKYLGVLITADKSLTCTSRADLVFFYRSANTILNVVYKPSNEIQMKLLYCICVPSLTYAAEVKVLPSREMTRLHVAVNDSIRKIFGFNRWESVKHLGSDSSFNSVTEIFAARRKSSWKVFLSLVTTSCAK